MQSVVFRLFALALTLSACVPDYEGGGRRATLPELTSAGGAAGVTGAGGFGLSGTSDSAVDSGSEAGEITDCPVDAGYVIETGAVCAIMVPVGTRCRLGDGGECVCRTETFGWDCG